MEAWNNAPAFLRRLLAIDQSASSANTKSSVVPERIPQLYADLGVHVWSSAPARLPLPAEDMKSTSLPLYLTQHMSGPPTVVQSTLWPLWSCGVNLIVSSATEILPYDVAAPIIFHVMNQPLLEVWDSPIVLYLSATQMRTETIHAGLCDGALGTHLKIGALMGPMPIGFDRPGFCPDILVATPGRLKNFETLMKGFNRTTLVIVDEWCIHMNAGFSEYIRSLIENRLRSDIHLVILDRYRHVDQHPILSTTIKDPVPFISLSYGHEADTLYIPPTLQNPSQVDTPQEASLKFKFWSRNPSCVLALRYVTSINGSRVHEDVFRECPSGTGIRVEESKSDGPCRYRVFLDYGNGNEKLALDAYRVMHGRQYNGHTITAQFLSEDTYRSGDQRLVAEEVESVQSRTLLLRNVISSDAGQINAELRSELEEECSCFGAIDSIRFVLVPKGHWEHEGEAVRVFLRYTSFDGAAEAMTNINGRMFGGKAISAVLYDEVRMAHNDLGMCRDAEPELPLLSTILN